MRPLNKSQRHALYKRLLEEIKQCKGHLFYGGLCAVLHIRLNFRHDIYVLPELMAQRPKRSGLYWWKSNSWTP